MNINLTANEFLSITYINITDEVYNSLMEVQEILNHYPPMYQRPRGAAEGAAGDDDANVVDVRITQSMDLLAPIFVGRNEECIRTLTETVARLREVVKVTGADDVSKNI